MLHCELGNRNAVAENSTSVDFQHPNILDVIRFQFVVLEYKRENQTDFQVLLHKKGTNQRKPTIIYTFSAQFNQRLFCSMNFYAEISSLVPLLL